MYIRPILVLVALLNCCIAYAADSMPFERARIYYYGWSVVTRSKLSLDDVRSRARIATLISDRNETTALWRWLFPRNPSRLSGFVSEDPRLVIDFEDASGKRTTYYSGGKFLVSESGLRIRAIDSKFRQRFTFSGDTK